MARFETTTGFVPPVMLNRMMALKTMMGLLMDIKGITDENHPLPSRLLAASRRWNNYRHLLPGLSGEALEF